MPRTVEHEPLTKHTLFLYAGDFSKLAAYYPKIGASVIVRRIVRQYLNKIDNEASETELTPEGLDNV